MPKESRRIICERSCRLHGILYQKVQAAQVTILLVSMLILLVCLHSIFNQILSAQKMQSLEALLVQSNMGAVHFLKLLRNATNVSFRVSLTTSLEPYGCWSTAAMALIMAPPAASIYPNDFARCTIIWSRKSVTILCFCH